MRKEPDETSEMVNQVLFGESFSILENNKPGNFSLIRLDHDNYEGWINSRCIYFLPEKEQEFQKSHLPIVTHELLNFLQPLNDDAPRIIGCGSLLQPTSPGKIMIGSTEYRIPEIQVNDPLKIREDLISYGLKLLSVPYLWGGRGSFGFDCSGLCQNLFRQVGIEIPRDASKQAGTGHPISFINDAQAGDLAFFDNAEGNIIHVGMIIGEGKILHASGRVKIDQVDHQGIFSTEHNRYTHELRLVKKLV
jgi:cell wall-associated NlpC family hydrolase